MTRRKDPGPDEPVDFGDLDGEKIEAAYIKVTATVPIDRLLTEGERVILSVEGPVSLPTVERHDGRLVRVHKVKGEKGAEVALYSEGDDRPVAHVVATYSIPPDARGRPK